MTFIGESADAVALHSGAPAAGWTTGADALATEPVRFARLFVDHASALRRYAERIVRSRDAAEDVVQEVFLRLWLRRHRVELGAGMRSYLYLATHDRALSHIARLRREHERLPGALAPGIAGVAPALPEDDEPDGLARAIERVVASLPPRQREVTLLRLRHQLPSAEIARRLDISPRTVEVHLARATRTLRMRLPALLSRESMP